VREKVSKALPSDTKHPIDVEISVEGGNRIYKVYNKGNSLLIFTCFTNKTAY
jgi:hypothetical protein